MYLLKLERICKPIILSLQLFQYKTRQSEITNTSPRHMPVLDNVHPIKIENFDIFRDVISLHARVFILLIDRATQEVPMKNI